MTNRGTGSERACAARCPSDGERFWGPLHVPSPLNVSMRECLDRANDEVLAIGTIGRFDALDAMDADAALHC